MGKCFFCYDNLLDGASITPSSQVGGFGIDNITHKWTSRSWRSASGSGTLVEYFVVNLGSAKSVDFFFVPWHNLSSNAVVKLQANSSNSWTSPPVDITLSVAESLFYSWSTPVSYQYWRLHLTDSTPLTTYLEIGSWTFLGTKFQPTRNFSNSYSVTYNDLSTINRSRGGQLSSMLAPKYKSMRLSFEYVTSQDADMFEDMFDKVGLAKSLYFIMDDASILNTVLYCRLMNPPSIVNLFNNIYFSAAVELEELL